jgi:NHL repeat-containing protein
MRASVRAPAGVLLSMAVSAALTVAAAPLAPAAPVSGAAPGTITTQAGGPGRGDVGGVAMDPMSVGTGPGGAVYVADVGIVRGFTAGSAHEDIVAGVGVQAYSGDGGPAVWARLHLAGAATPDRDGNVVIADAGSGRIRVVATSSGTFYGQAMTAGDIYTVAGTGSAGFSGDGGPARSADLWYPQGVAPDHAGNIVIADTLNSRVRVVAVRSGTFYGQAMTAGDIYTVAGTGSKLGALGDGGPAVAARLARPDGVTVDARGDLVIADTGWSRVRVAAAGSGTFYGRAMTAGDIYTVAGTGKPGYTGDQRLGISARLQYPRGVAVDGDGNIVIADTDNYRVRVVPAKPGTYYRRAMTAGYIYTVAGNGKQGTSGDRGLAVNAELRHPSALAAGVSGNVVIGDDLGSLVRVMAGSDGTYYGQAMLARHIYTISPPGLNQPGGVALDRFGNVVVADTDNSLVRVISGRAGTFYGQAMTPGHMYTIAGTGSFGYTGDGGPATAAALSFPAAVTVDPAGNVLITDGANYRVRAIAARSGTFYGKAMTAGDIYTIAGNGSYGYTGDGGPATEAELSGLSGLTTDQAGNVILAGSVKHRLRLIAARSGTFYGTSVTAGDIYTIAGTGRDGYFGDGGPATSAQLSEPLAVAPDSSGNLLVADTGNHRVRLLAGVTGVFYGQAMVAGDIYTIAGNGKAGFSGDRGPATSAHLHLPGAVISGPGGEVVIADSGNLRVRVISR